MLQTLNTIICVLTLIFFVKVLHDLYWNEIRQFLCFGGQLVGSHSLAYCHEQGFRLVAVC